MSTDEMTGKNLDEGTKETLQRQLRGSLLAKRKSADTGFNPQATAKRRAKNRVAAKSRRANRRTSK